MADDKVLTEAEIEDAKKLAEAEEAKKIDFTDEQFEAEFEKRLGAKSSEFIKKSDQVKVLTEDEKKEVETKKETDLLKFGLDNNIISKKEYDDYLTLTATNKIEVARKKFIANSSDTSEEAGKTFDTLFKVTEDDEIEDNEVMVPNKKKKDALAFAEKLAQEEIDSTVGKKVKDLPAKYAKHLESEAVKTTNTAIITKAITDIPKRLEVDVDGTKYGINLTDEDFTEAHNLAVEGVLTKNGLTAKEVQETANIYILAKNVNKLLKEGISVAVKAAVDKVERGKSGVTPNQVDPPAVADAKMEFLKKRGISVPSQ